MLTDAVQERNGNSYIAFMISEEAKLDYGEFWSPLSAAALVIYYAADVRST